uniref:Uncharacterized protein n=1 Tax=Arundo donax TaxID=35708 RepID=A0A0A8ZNM4_ARUDO
MQGAILSRKLNNRNDWHNCKKQPFR